jgi:ectoine hydroxylase-related dioxygenase (phytanoyl-CoA dioxygenase family)
MLSDDGLERFFSEGYVIAELLPRSRIDEMREIVRGIVERRGMSDSEREQQAIRDIATRRREFMRIVTADTIVDIAQQLLGRDVKLHWSTIFLKPPQVGSDISLHQDSQYSSIRFQGNLTVWIPLDEADEENGCLEVIPGRHLDGALPHEETSGGKRIRESCYDSAEITPLPMEPGQVLFFDPLLPHRSSANSSDRWRRAFAFGLASARSRKTEDVECVQISGRSFPGCI